MSALQKQLLARRNNRVGHKQKKILAMMEQETVIDDPSSKSVQLLNFKKIEVLHNGQYAKPTAAFKDLIFTHAPSVLHYVMHD